VSALAVCAIETDVAASTNAVVTAVCTSALVPFLNVMTSTFRDGCDEWFAPPIFTDCVEGQMYEKVLGIAAKT
jgi:hypothetical protein